MTIQQMVEIPADHRLLLDIRVPSELPSGKAMVELTFNSTAEVPETITRNAVKSLRGLFKDLTAVRYFINRNFPKTGVLGKFL